MVGYLDGGPEMVCESARLAHRSLGSSRQAATTCIDLCIPDFTGSVVMPYCPGNGLWLWSRWARAFFRNKIGCLSMDHLNDCPGVRWLRVANRWPRESPLTLPSSGPACGGPRFSNGPVDRPALHTRSLNVSVMVIRCRADSTCCLFGIAARPIWQDGASDNVNEMIGPRRE